MTERELYVKCIPQITEIALEIQKMTVDQYIEFKHDYLQELRVTCPKAIGFMEKILLTIEWCIMW